MAGLNKVMIIGNLGKDPEIKYAQSGTAICKFTVATSEQWNDKSTGQKQEKVEWHNITSFGKQAETLEKYLKKGSQIFIEGRIQTSTYEKDGQTKYFTEIVVSSFQFLGEKSNNGQTNNSRPAQGYNQNQQQQQPGNQGNQQPIPDDTGIPF